jgi:predicted amidohydrolase
VLLAACQFDIAWEDKAANHATIESMLDDAGIEPGTYVLLPELGDTGFSFDLEAIVDERSLAWACDLAQRRGIWLQPGYAVRGPDGRGRNCAAIVSPQGVVVGVYQKVHPFTYSQEASHYTGGDHLCLRDVEGTHVCPLICYDLRFPELWRHAVLGGTELFTIGASWPDGRQAHWRALLIARAIENQAYVVAVNRVGADPNLSYAGGSIVISPTGEVIAEADSGPTVLRAELDLPALRRWRDKFPALADLRRELLGSIKVDTTITKTDIGAGSGTNG